VKCRKAESFDDLAVFAGEMTRVNVDVIVTEGAQGVSAAKRAIGKIPIVMATSAMP
jgi:hypothetical protein